MLRFVTINYVHGAIILQIIIFVLKFHGEIHELIMWIADGLKQCILFAGSRIWSWILRKEKFIYFP